MYALILAAALLLEFEIDGMTCPACPKNAIAALRSIRGVTKVTVDLTSSEARVEANRTVTKDEIRAALKKTGLEARFEGEERVPRLSAEERARLDIRVASRGAAIELRRHLARGKVTIFDFWADWCGPCHLLTPRLERLVHANDGVALRTIDVSSWESEIAKQATRDFRMNALPYVRVYGRDGRFVGAVYGNDIDRVRALVEKATR
jgi:thiol-disulfide isomerase/thioredoxin